MRITLASQAAIEARLRHAPADGRSARIKAAGGVRLNGALGPVDRDLCLPMVPTDAVPDSVLVGSPIHATVVDASDTITFYTTVEAVTDQDHILLRFPSVVQIAEHRDEFREPLDLDECVRIEFSDGQRSSSFTVVDVSPQGLSFRFAKDQLLVNPGLSLSARLTAPGLPARITEILVRNVRSDPEQRHAMVAGVQLIRPTTDLLEWLHHAKKHLRYAI